MRKLRRGLVVSALLAVVTVASAQVNLTFEKTAVSDRVWIGTVNGDISGTLVTTLIAADQSQPVWDIELYWIILADDPSQSFVARLTGTLNTETGAVAMTGAVDEGFNAGATVEEAGQLQNAETSNFTGTIVLTGTAADGTSPRLVHIGLYNSCAGYVRTTLRGGPTECE